MRTRAQGSTSPVASSPQPSTRRRKRASNGADDSEHEAVDFNTPDDGVDANDTVVVASITTTPTKPTKRVRFSDPGPVLTQSETSSSGLTPHLQRFSMTSPILMSQSSPRGRSRRRSLPATLSQSSSDAAMTIQEVQFTPLKQLLGERTKRRLRRIHLSETMNDFEAHQKQEARMRRELSELVDLRKQAELREDTVKDLSLELELQRQLGIEVNQEEEERVKTLKNEIDELRQELAKYSAPAPDSNSLVDEDLTVMEHEAGMIPIIKSDVDMADGTAQTVAAWTPELQRAQSTLCNLTDLLKTLGFPGTDANEIIFNIQETFRSTRLALEHMLPGETPTGLSSPATLFAHTLTHIRTLLSRLQTTKQSLATTQNTERALRGQFNSTLARLTTLTASKDQLDADYHALRKRANAREARIADLTAECAASTASTNKLQTALESYRAEVANLERVVTSLDKEKQTVEAALQQQLAEKQAAIRALQDEVAQRADDAEAAVDRADELQRALARAEREIEEGKGEGVKSSNEAQRLVGGVLRVFERAGREAEGLAGGFLGVLDSVQLTDGGREELKGLVWSGKAKIRDSGVGFLEDVD